MPEAVTASGRVRNLIVHGHVNTVSRFTLFCTVYTAVPGPFSGYTNVKPADSNPVRGLGV